MANCAEIDEEETSEEKRQRLLKDPVVQELLREERERHGAVPVGPPPPILAQDFMVNDPVHGLMHLPRYVKEVIDTLEFQRMRHIKQLGICCMVYPGATHNRYFHSVGTCYLAFEFMKILREKQPELGISTRDTVAVTLAGLAHDLGHPCFSHLFESFMHKKGYPDWSHEDASLIIVRKVLNDLQDKLKDTGLCKDQEGDDFQFIEELINPPKRKLEELQQRRELKQKWSSVVQGRPVEKAFLYEVVSNWRTGIDVDKFDYFRRDALHLGIGRQFDHMRYMKGVRVVLDSDAGEGVLTISPPEKEKDNLLANLCELRKNLHTTAYQHKTVKKYEQHLIDILHLLDEKLQITGTGGKKMKISEAALTVDSVAYMKLTDAYLESLLLCAEDANLSEACQMYSRHFVERNLMRFVLGWEVPNSEEQEDGFTLPQPGDFITGMLEEYTRSHPARPIPRSELRCAIAKLHYGMGSTDPIKKIVFHDKAGQTSMFEIDHDANPLRRKLFVFWNPATIDEDHNITLMRLIEAAQNFGQSLLPRGELVSTPQKKRKSLTSTNRQSPATSTAAQVAKRARQLRMQSSCPANM